MKRFFYAVGILGLVVAGAACSRQGSKAEDRWPDGIENAADAPDTLTHHASLLTIVDRGSYVSVELADPWKKGATLGRYALVHKDSAIPEGIPAGVTTIRVPVERAAVFSTVHANTLPELGALPSLVAVADGSFFAPADTVSSLIASGKVSDVGSSMSPSIEKLVASRAEIALLSPMEGTASPISDRLPVKPVYMADYMERSPIGRAEWILLLGELFGQRDRASGIFTGVIDSYSDLVFKKGSSAVKAPKVITELESSGVWYVPAGESYMARMLSDAGADYPWASTKGAGSLSLDMAQVLDRASDADVWLMRLYGHDASRASVLAANPLNEKFKAFRTGEVYSCNTADRPIFNDIAFHPEKVLADYVAIFHPDVMPGYELRYYKKMK